MSAPDIRHAALANGMKLVTRRNGANPTVSIQLSIACAGSVSDPDGKVGLASFARSLLTKGTVKRSAAEVAEAIDSLGLELGFSTGRHTLAMSARVLAENLSPALELIREIVAEPAPTPDEYQRMRERIVTGLKRRLDDPAAVATDELMEMIYGAAHPYGRTARHKLDCIADISLEEIAGWHAAMLVPGAAVAVLVGDFDADGIDKLVADALGSWAGGGKFVLEPPEPVAQPSGTTRKFIGMPEKTQSDVALGYPCIARLDPAYHALQVGNTVLGRLSLGGRVGQRVRDREGMAYYAYTAFDAGVGAGPFMFRAGVSPENVDRAVELALEEMGKAAAEGITAEEMEDSVLYLSGGMARQVETNGGMASTLLNQEIFGLGDDYYLRFESILRDLTLEQVNAALAAHLHPEDYCLAIAGPE